MRGRGVSLPEGHEVAAELELTGENAGMNDRTQRLAQLDATREKLEVRAIADTSSPVDERAIFPTLVLSNLSHGIHFSRISGGPWSFRGSKHVPRHQNKYKETYSSRQRSTLPVMRILTSSQKGRHNRAAFRAPSSICLTGRRFHLVGVHIKV
jgi:hypothetical protein